VHDFGFRTGRQSASVNLFNITTVNSGLPPLIVLRGNNHGLDHAHPRRNLYWP
jgi:hypothetical protein